MIVAGFGFNSGATAESLEQALNATGYAGPITQFATPMDKALAPPLLEFARAKTMSINAVPPRKLQEMHTQTQSLFSKMMRKTGSVAEAAALATAGPGAKLIVTRQISEDSTATCAIAEGPDR